MGGGHGGERQVPPSLILSASSLKWSQFRLCNSDPIHPAGASAPAAKYDGHHERTGSGGGGSGIGTRFAEAGLVPSEGQRTVVGAGPFTECRS